MRENRKYSHPHRRGAVLVLVALLLTVLAGVVGLAVDVGYVCSVKSQLQATADSAALAGASGLGVSLDEARRRALEYAQKNKINGVNFTLKAEDVQLGKWDPVTHVFTPMDPALGLQASALRVTPRLSSDRGNQLNLCFGSLFGVSSVNVSTSATAVFGPRDMVVVLDYSSSMSYDSQLRNISRLGRTAVEQNLQDIWMDLGSPTYGKMQLTPTYVAPSSSVQQSLGLTDVPYPFPVGSWSEYIKYIQSDSAVRDAGYANRYGYLTLVNYWMARRPMASETPVLWKGREQPITAVKDAVSVFLSYMRQAQTDDRVGLGSYTYTNGQGKLEVQLTSDYDLIETTARHRQAGNYHTYTNIAAGIETGRTELMTRGRANAVQVLVLLSDGNANWTQSNTYDPTRARKEALDEARLMAAKKYPIVTISLGVEADTDLMQQIADITGGVHFIVPGGHAVSEYQDQLTEVFRKVAAYRPMKLVD